MRWTLRSSGFFDTKENRRIVCGGSHRHERRTIHRKQYTRNVNQSSLSSSHSIRSRLGQYTYRETHSRLASDSTLERFRGTRYGCNHRGGSTRLEHCEMRTPKMVYHLKRSTRLELERRRTRRTQRFHVDCKSFESYGLCARS